MKKVLSIVLALALVFGFAGMTFAMGPTAADATNVGLVLTSFAVSDSVLSPLMIQNWNGTLQPTKTYAEGMPIWFVASYVQNKVDTGDPDRNFMTGQITAKTTIFTSLDNCVNYAYSASYMNFALVSGIQAIAASVDVSGVGSQVDATAKALEVEFQTVQVDPPGVTTIGTAYVYTHAANLLVADATTVTQNYYLQIMAFTNACNEAQGTAIAKTPIDKGGFPDSAVTALTILAPADVTGGAAVLGTLSNAIGASNTHWLNLYDGATIKYTVVKFRFNNAVATGNLKNISADDTSDNLYMVYDTDDKPVMGFVSSGKVFRGLANFDTANADFGSVQYTSDSGGKYVYTEPASINGGKAIDKADLEKLMTFMGFSFGNDYPVLDKHWEAMAGWWKVFEAKYNVAAAVITNPDPGVDIVPKTGDVSTAFGMIMVAIAGLAAVGFVMMKRVRG